MSKGGGIARDGGRESAAPLPSIPAKRYFTIGEVSELCAVKPHVLRYWEQEFSQLKPIKRSGNRRYYQHHEVLLIRRIRDLLYEQGFTINGARNRLEGSPAARRRVVPGAAHGNDGAANESAVALDGHGPEAAAERAPGAIHAVRAELESIRALLAPVNGAPGPEHSGELS
jgi:DNA-binding transcriptional MerR regulator